jgi:tRNA pseudouridine55 synthase
MTAVVRGLVGKLDLSVPVFSSRRVGGKPLFAWVRSESGIPPEVPVRRMSVSQIDMAGIGEIGRSALIALAIERVGLVTGDFRQSLITEAWRSLPAEGPALVSMRLTIQCGSGTYIRSVIHEIGRRLRCGAVVAELRRIRVGPWQVTDPEVIRFAWPR